MGISMGESYRVDRGASERTVADVRVAAADVAQQAAAMRGAFDALAAAAGGSPDIAAALTSFGAGRTGTASRIGTHLHAVSTVGAVALAAVVEADAHMATQTVRAARR
jgi:hypothetical protein